LKPKAMHTSLDEIDWQRVREEWPKVEKVVFDKDNTLTVPYSSELHPKVQPSFENCLTLFGARNLAILSNSAGTKDDRSFKWKSQIEKSLGVPVIVHKRKKPGCFQEVLTHFSLSASESHSVLIVGDRLVRSTIMFLLKMHHKELT